MSTPLVLRPGHHHSYSHSHHHMHQPRMDLDAKMYATESYYPSSEDEDDEALLAEQTTQLHNGDFAMQKYLLLQNQHDALLQHMDALCPTYAGRGSSPATTTTTTDLSSTTTTTTTPKHHPRRHHHRSGSGRVPPSTASAKKVIVQATLPPVLDESLVLEMAAAERRLGAVNEGLKRALTELLNCEPARRDRGLRAAVQGRLMETERELRTGRRRRSNECV